MTDEHPLNKLVTDSSDKVKELIDSKVPDQYKGLANFARQGLENLTLNGLKKQREQRNLNDKPEAADGGLNKQKKQNWFQRTWSKIKNSKFGKWAGNVWDSIKGDAKSMVSKIPHVGGLINTGIDALEKMDKEVK